MNSTAETIRPAPVPDNMHRSIPILSSSTSTTAASSASSLSSPQPPAAGDPMDTTPPTSGPAQVPMGPPSQALHSPTIAAPAAGGAPTSAPHNTTANGEAADASNDSGNAEGSGQDSHGDAESSAVNGSAATTTGAAAAAMQPKVVQTAFIHKLYNMLEDKSIQHLISWSANNESFLMSPSNEFSKVLSSYFKHTNISSFVRQLNMYGFHKVSDVFQTGSPESAMWEFKHGHNYFKRGDLTSLRDIKRRASRHTLIQRDTYPTAPKGAPTQPGPPPETMPDPLEARLNILEHNFYDVNSRLSRTEDHYAYMNQRCRVLSDNLHRSFQWNVDLTTTLLTMMPDPESAVHRDVSILQREINRQIETFRSWEEQSEPPSSRHTYFANIGDGHGPVSPRQMAVDDSRRGSTYSPSTTRRSSLRPPTASTTGTAATSTVSPLRFGSIGGNSAYSPSGPPRAGHPHPPPPPPPPSSYQPPLGLGRRHTSADIRQHGWQPHLQGPPPNPSSQQSPYASGNNSTQWPSSPHPAPIPHPPPPSAEQQQLRESFAKYQIGGGGGAGRRPSAPLASIPSHLQVSQHPPLPSARGPSPPPTQGGAGDPGWTLPAARFPPPPFKIGAAPDTAPPTRRSSMATSVHNLLNPTSETPEEDEMMEDRKRKRLI